MKPDRWVALKELLADALEHPREDRAQRLRDATKDDPELLAEAELLLAREEESEGFLERPVVEDPVRYAPELGGLPPGATLGPFLIEGVHAVGGASVVYTARQEAPDRRVALKVLCVGPRRQEALRRFEVEKELLARLSHPGIAEIFGAATASEAEAGAPWIAMELIEDARTLVDYARTVRPSSDEGNEADGMSWQQRVRLFLEVCDAVHHGHLRGVVHRDLKPANLLVNSEGRVKVIDFGIARVLDATSADTVTRHGDFLGTLAYMSPEQLDGDARAIDTRSDVYSLGVVLYELLCGELPVPLEGQSITGAVRLVQERAPRRLTRLVPESPKDLEAVILRALAKDPSRRYTNAGDLADDLRCVLEHRPVRARSPRAAHTVGLFLRRHRVAAFMVLVVVASLGTAAASFVARTIETARVERVEREKLEKVTEFLSSLLMFAVPSTENADPRVRDVVDLASDRLEEDLAFSPEARADLHLTLGMTYLELGAYDRAHEHLDQAVVLQRAVEGPRAPWAACALDMKGEALIREGRPIEALAILDEAYELYSSDPNQPPFMKGLAANKRAKAYRMKGDLDDAERNAREALALFEASFGSESGTTARAVENLGLIAADDGDFDRAEELLRRALSVDVEQGGDGSLRVAKTRFALGSVLARAGRRSEARELVASADEVIRRVLPEGHEQLAKLDELRRSLTNE